MSIDFDFSTFLTDLDHGRVNQDISIKLSRVVDKVAETGKPGQLTIKIKVNKEGEMAKVDVQAEGKEPSHPLHGTLFFFTAGGGLTRKDPRQLDLKHVSQEPAPLRALNGEDEK